MVVLTLNLAVASPPEPASYLKKKSKIAAFSNIFRPLMV
jgi:hypothetical protein